MVSAFVFLECKRSFLESLLFELQKIEGVQRIYRVSEGPYDLILKVAADDRHELRKKVEDIVGIGHIYNNLSLIVI